MPKQYSKVGNEPKVKTYDKQMTSLVVKKVTSDKDIFDYGAESKGAKSKGAKSKGAKKKK